MVTGYRVNSNHSFTYSHFKTGKWLINRMGVCYTGKSEERKDKMRDVLDIHTHTLVSGHAYNTIMEMVQAAAEKGLELLGITDHAPEMPGGPHLFYFNNLKVMPREINGMPVLFGTEVNIMDYNGKLDLPESTLKQMDVVIASLHTPCIKAGSMQENTRAVVAALRNPYVNIIGHPDDGRYPVDMEQVVAAAKEEHKLLELNNHSLDPSGTRVGAEENDTLMLKYCMKYQQPVIMGSDAHCIWDIRNHDLAVRLIKKAGFPEELVVNRSTDEFMTYIRKQAV